MANTHYAYQIDGGIESIQGQIAARTIGDDQLPNLPSHSTADARVPFQDLDRNPHLLERVQGRLGRTLEKELHQALEILKRRRGIDYTRHRTALGRRALRPRTFASR